MKFTTARYPGYEFQVYQPWNDFWAWKIKILTYPYAVWTGWGVTKGDATKAMFNEARRLRDMAAAAEHAFAQTIGDDK